MPTTTGTKAVPKVKAKPKAKKKETPVVKPAGMFDDLKAKIAKKVKGVHCSVMSESDIANVEKWIPLPTFDLNRITSGELYKGLPEKSLTLLVGQEHTFKSSLAVLTAKSALEQGFKPVIIDTEGGITKDFAARWGVDTDKCLYVYSPWAEEIKGVLAQIKETQERILARLPKRQI